MNVLYSIQISNYLVSSLENGEELESGIQLYPNIYSSENCDKLECDIQLYSNI